MFIENGCAEEEPNELAIIPSRRNTARISSHNGRILSALLGYIASGGNKSYRFMTRDSKTRRLFLLLLLPAKHGNTIEPHRPGSISITRHAIDLSSFWFQTLRFFLLHFSRFLFFHGLLHQATRLSSIASVDKITSFSFRIHAIPW